MKEKIYLTSNKKLMDEWDWGKNDALNLLPNFLTVSSHKKAWWKCPVCGNEWFAEIKSRNAGRSCPICARKNRKNTSPKKEPIILNMKILYLSFSQS